MLAGGQGHCLHLAVVGFDPLPAPPTRSPTYPPAHAPAPQVGDKAEEVAQLRSAAEAADAARAEAVAAAAAAQAASDEAAAALSRAERKLVLLGKERDGLQAILASYDEEYLNQHGGWDRKGVGCWVPHGRVVGRGTKHVLAFADAGCPTPQPPLIRRQRAGPAAEAHCRAGGAGGSAARPRAKPRGGTRLALFCCGGRFCGRGRGGSTCRGGRSALPGAGGGSRQSGEAGGAAAGELASVRAEGWLLWAGAENRHRLRLLAHTTSLTCRSTHPQERLGRGEYNAGTTRVLHFKFNPEAEVAREARDARLAEMEAENEALKSALQRVEAAAAQGQASTDAGGAAGGAGSMRLAQLEGEANLLRRKVAELQKGMDRLQQVRNGRSPDWQLGSLVGINAAAAVYACCPATAATAPTRPPC